jgi:hypothetical protein
VGHDPYGPNYQPDAQGTRGGLGDVGGGGQFGTDLHALYRAGRLHFPQKAELFSGFASDAQYAGWSIDLAKGPAGDPPALSRILELREDLHHAVYQMATSLSAIGPVLVTIADDYAATDEEARGSFQVEMEANAGVDDYSDAPVTVTPPPRPEDPYVPEPELIPRPNGTYQPF